VAREPDAPDLAPDLELTEVDGGSADGARIVDAAVPRLSGREHGVASRPITP
jgi:hypothetical protein